MYFSFPEPTCLVARLPQTEEQVVPREMGCVPWGADVLPSRHSASLLQVTLDNFKKLVAGRQLETGRLAGNHQFLRLEVLL